jgi:hypothetical protein
MVRFLGIFEFDFVNKNVVDSVHTSWTVVALVHHRQEAMQRRSLAGVGSRRHIWPWELAAVPL